MRVLHVASGRLFGGIERMLTTFAGCDGPASDSLESRFALCARGRALEELSAAAARVECLGDVRVSRPGSVWRARARLRRLIADDRPDVIVCHAPWAYALFAPTARRAGARLVWWQHDAATGRPWIERWARNTTADLVISNSGWTARSAAAVQPRVPVQVIHCPVPPPPAFDEERRRAMRASFDTDARSTVVVCAARLEPWKGHARLLRALATLRDDSTWTLWIAGGAQRPREAAYLETLRREASSLGLTLRVRWLGERRDVPAVLAAADLLCQPNLTPEPFGLVFAEALLGGIPVVTSNMGGAPEIVGASCGRLLPVDDDDALSAALRELIGDPALRRRLGGTGRAHAAAVCGPSIVMPRLVDALRALTARAAA